jgi:FkbM family methyltransferase
VDKLRDALALIGREVQLREPVVRLCHEIETLLAKPDFDVREQVTGPIIDALHRDSSILRKRLSNGLDFHFLYSGKIARDLVMSADAEPDHVWEPQTTKLLLHLASDARTVLIAGAYAGDQALMVAQRLRDHGGVCHCFEPNGEQFAILEQNVRANGLARHMVLNNLGLWDRENVRLRLVGDDALGSSEEADPADGAPAIQTTTVDAYGVQREIESIDVLMLDVEGAENAVLRGASHYLSQPAGQAPNVVFEIHRSYVDWSNGLERTDVGQLLVDHGYKLHAVRDYQSNVAMPGYPVELVCTDGVYLEGPPHGFNMLAVKDERVLDDPLFRFCSAVSPKLLRHREPRLHQPLARG